MVPLSLTRNSYHTNLKLACYHGLLPLAFKHRIPKSTLASWRKTNPSRYVGNDFDSFHKEIDKLKLISQSQAALATACAVARFASFCKSLLKGLQGSADQITKTKNPELRARIVTTLNRLKDNLPLSWMLKTLGLTRARFASWSRNQNCSGSPLALCRRRHPNQLTLKELRLIKKAFSDPQFKTEPAVSLAWRLVNSGQLSANVSTITRYARILGLSSKKTIRKAPKKRGSITTSKPNEVWHVDVTFIPCLDGTKAAVSFVLDNFSRKVLSYRISDNPSWKATVEVLKEAQRLVTQVNSNPTVLITDAGSENCNAKVSETVQAFSLKHLVAQRDVAFSNSVIEAWNKILKYRYIFPNPIPDKASLEPEVAKAVFAYNDRPHYLLNGLTPNQAHRGEVFDKANYHQRILEALDERRRVNRLSCPPCKPWRPEFEES